MCRPIRSLTQAKGHDASTHVLACFGGAGGQHACAVARALGMKRVFVHRHSGLLSAVGLALADIAVEEQAPYAKPLTQSGMSAVNSALDKLEEQARDRLTSQGIDKRTIKCTRFLNLRYEGTDVALMISTDADELVRDDEGRDLGPTSVHVAQPAKGHLTQIETAANRALPTFVAPATQAMLKANNPYLQAFTKRYMREHGFTCPDRGIIVDDIRVRVTGGGKDHTMTSDTIPRGDDLVAPMAVETVSAQFDQGRISTPVFLLASLLPGHRLLGPAIIVEANSTIVVEPFCTAVACGDGDLEILIGDGIHKRISVALDPVQLSVFGHRFMSIAEQMGRQLQRTSISTNIKERLDFR